MALQVSDLLRSPRVLGLAAMAQHMPRQLPDGNRFVMIIVRNASTVVITVAVMLIVIIVPFVILLVIGTMITTVTCRAVLAPDGDRDL